MSQPIILCGLGRMGGRVLEYLQAARLPVVVVDTACTPDDPRLHGGRLIRGDFRQREVLEAAGVRDARGVLLLTADDLVNISAALLVRTLNPDVRIVLRMFNQNLIGRLGQAFPNVFALSTSLLTAPILAMTALTGQALGTFRLEGVSDGRRQVAELTIGPGSSLRGRTLVEVTSWRETSVLAHLPAAGEARFLLDVDLEARLAPGDRVVVCGDPRSVGTLLAGGSEGGSTGLRWASRLRRYARIARRALTAVDRPVAICTAVLLGCVVVSTVVLRLTGQDPITGDSFTLGKSFLRTVGIMATASGLHEDEFRHFESMMVFVSVLRIVGAVLLATFTAIVTNYLIRARLAGALEVGRIPESGHVVVCGLTPVGFRVVEELIALGEPVVVIEIDPTNRFVSTVRRLKTAVIIGDATIPEVQRQARAADACAVVAATNNDMVNLEVGLLVREMKSDQRVVLLQGDPNLAQMMRQGANIRFAVSVPALAAPAFLAGLFGDRVLSVFLVNARLLAAINLVVQEHDPFVGQSVRALAVDYRMTPVALVPAGRDTAARQPLVARVGAGDRLVAIVAMPDLERLLRRQPASAAFAVDVTSFPLPARDWLSGLLRTERGGTLEEAQAALDRLPLRIGAHLTRGQAEDLLARLVRERISAKLVPIEEGTISGT
jgi:Trk K+ transport system NAD-binding subunit